METKIELKPVEQLYLVGKEKCGVYEKKNILFCLIYQLHENDNIRVSSKTSKFRINFSGKEPNSEYEDIFMKLIKDKKFIELDSFVTNLVLNQTLINHKILEVKIIPKKVLFFNMSKTEIIKTSKYYEIQASIMKVLDVNWNVTNAICKNHKSRDKIIRFYDALVKRMEEAKEKKNNEDRKGARENTIKGSPILSLF